MAKNGRDNTNDIVGGRDSLGPVHPLSREEELEAAMRLTETALRWRRKNRRSYDRVAYPLETMLLMTGIKEEPSEKYQVSDTMKKVSEASPNTYGRSEE